MTPLIAPKCIGPVQSQCHHVIAVSLTLGRALYAELILEERLLALVLSIERIHMTTHKGMDTMPAAAVALMNID